MAAALQPPEPVGRDFNQLRVFATVERTPSFEGTTRVRIGTFEGFGAGANSTYWFLREREDQQHSLTGRAVTDSVSCPASLGVVRRLEKLRLPHPDVPGYGRDYDVIVTDGIGYRLRGISRHPDGQPGDYSIESNTKTPLARWTDELFSSLDDCWKPMPTS